VVTDLPWRYPTYDGVLAARDRIAPYLRPTPLRRYPSLDRLVGTEVWVKHENHQPTGAFKVRGGVNLVSQLSEDERSAGLIAASTGNHGQSVAYAARLFGVKATICVPEKANPAKVASMKDLGATIVEQGRDFDDAKARAEELTAEHGYRYVNSGNEPDLIEGVGTYMREILDEQEVDVVLVPIGGGSGAAGTCLVAKSQERKVEVIGVQSEAAPAAYLSWRARSLVEDEMKTAAEGLATRAPFELPQRVMWELLDDFIVVSEGDIFSATERMIELTRTLVEGAGATALAGALNVKPRLEGRRVALVCSGGNITIDQLRDLLARERV
jgi:threonine dehydratase